MPDNAQPRRARRILLVEDEPLIRMIAAEMLANIGCEVLEAGNAAEALGIADEGLDRIDALMIDLGLPDQPGEQVIRKLLDRRSDLPVIVTTGADTVAAARRLDDCGTIRFLEKPYYFKDLREAIGLLVPAG
ncbi:MAG: pas/pac sensor hybrid histidine kinase [Caulobacteraceae bacterium]|nr:pas/pac sensor hybrid histidine kinase [Caulobacteraceae bacterium]